MDNLILSSRFDGEHILVYITESATAITGLMIMSDELGILIKDKFGDMRFFPHHSYDEISLKREDEK